MVKKDENGKVSCFRGSDPPCQEVVSTEEKSDWCYNTVSCKTCKLTKVGNPNLRENKGPPHWRGIASSATGTDVKDFGKN